MVSSARWAAVLLVALLLAIPLATFAGMVRPGEYYAGGDGFPAGQATYIMMRPAGHIAFVLLWVQLLLGACGPALALRLRVPGGVARWHRLLGPVCLAFVLLHPLLFFWARCLRSGAVEFGATFLPHFGENWWETSMALGVLGLYLLVAAAAAAILGRRGGRAWMWVHRANHAAFFLVAWHALRVGGETRSVPVNLAYGLMLVGAVVAIAHRLLSRKLAAVVLPSLPRTGRPWLRTGALGALAIALLVWPAVRETWRGRSAHEEQRGPTLSPEDGARLLDASRIVCVDIREPEEYAEFHIPGAVSVPLRHLADAPVSGWAEVEATVVYCLKDFRGFEGLRVLRRRGLANVHLLRGFGIRAWLKAGLPVAGRFSGKEDAAAVAETRRRGKAR